MRAFPFGLVVGCIVVASACSSSGESDVGPRSGGSGGSGVAGSGGGKATAGGTAGTILSGGNSGAAGAGGSAGSSSAGASGLTDCTGDSFEILPFDVASATPSQGTAFSVCGDANQPASLAPFGGLRKTPDGRLWLCVSRAGIFPAEEIPGPSDGDLERHVAITAMCGHGLKPRSGAKSNRIYAIVSLGIRSQLRQYDCTGNDEDRLFNGFRGRGVSVLQRRNERLLSRFRRGAFEGPTGAASLQATRRLRSGRGDDPLALKAASAHAVDAPPLDASNFFCVVRGPDGGFYVVIDDAYNAGPGLYHVAADASGSRGVTQVLTTPIAPHGASGAERSVFVSLLLRRGRARWQDLLADVISALAGRVVLRRRPRSIFEQHARLADEVLLFAADPVHAKVTLLRLPPNWRP